MHIRARVQCTVRGKAPQDVCPKAKVHCTAFGASDTLVLLDSYGSNLRGDNPAVLLIQREHCWRKRNRQGYLAICFSALEEEDVRKMGTSSG